MTAEIEPTIESQMVLFMSEPLEISDAQWELIVQRWNERGRQMLELDDVRDLLAEGIK